MYCLKTALIFSLIITCSAYSQLPMKNGRLNGHFEQINPNNETVVKGDFTDNFRTGKWTITYDSTDVIYTRDYSSKYGFKATDSENENPTIVKFDLIRDSSGLYNYPKALDSNIVWSKRVVSILTRKNNEEIYSANLLSAINKLVKKNEIKAYDDDEFSIVINKESFDVTNCELDRITLKKDYYYDKSLQMMIERIVALNFHLKGDDNKLNSFSIYYPTDGRKLLSSLTINYNSEIKHLDDFVFFRQYSDIIYDENKLDGSMISPDLDNPSKYEDLSTRVKSLIINAEHSFWLSH
tara:strand:+ start:67942 stop:68826 length:885 start_codon:yes stop_codon:yes gene_type:complete